MADNPFEDPDVQAAANNSGGGGGGGPPPEPQYSAVGAYDNSDSNNNNNNNNSNNNNNNSNDNNVSVNMEMQQINKYVPPEQQKQIAMAAGQQVANQAMSAAKDEYNQSNATQADHHEAPPPPPFCVKLFNWFPLRAFAFFGGTLMILCPILDMVFQSGTPFIAGFIYLYLICFGIIIMFVESPTWKATRWFQLKFFFWFRLLSRMWGRAWFYLFISVLCYAGVEQQGFTATLCAGIYVTCISLLSFIFSRMAGKKYVRIYTYVAAGTEGDELVGKFMRKFDELNMTNDGRIGSAEVVKLAEQASRVLSNSERHAIQTFLDESCNGFVSKEDWMKMWMEYNIKQKFL